MKNTTHPPQEHINRGLRAARPDNVRTATFSILALLGAVLLFVSPARANLLSNGDFSLPNSDANPTSWTTWTYNPGGYQWAEHRIITTELIDHGHDNTGIYDHTYAMKLGASSSTGSAGVYQIVSGGPNATYTLTCDSGMQAWWLMYGEIRLIFLDASNVVITNYVVRTTDPLHTEYNGTTTNIYDLGVVMRRWTNSAVSPLGTTQVRVEFVGTGADGGNCWFDNAVLTSLLVPPVIANLYPNGAILMQVTNTLSFTASSGAAITNIQVVLNGVDVSPNLVVTGSSTSKAVTYSGLKTNQAYVGTITIKDANSLSASVPLNFDTFNPAFMWEAEDFDYYSGLYINNPVLSSTPAPDSYFGVVGTQDIDENDTGNNGPELYRANDFMSTGLAGDTPRQKFLTAQTTDPAIKDYSVGYFDTGEWVNYTRNFPAGKYNIYARLASANSSVSAVMDQVTGGQGTATQTTTPLGSFKYAGTGWDSYQYVPLTDTYNNLVAVDLNGVTTLRVTAGPGNMNFFLIVPARLDLPLIGNAYPDGALLMQVTNKFSFTVTSASATIPTSGIHLTLNGVDVTSSLVIAGTSTSKSASYTGLKTNTTYTAVINVTDANGSSGSSTLHFDTFKAMFLWEGEDWDYSSGQYLNNPVPTSTMAANSYFGLVGVQGVDENETGTDPANLYRAGDPMAAGPCGDVPRQKYVDAQALDSNVIDWNVGWFDAGQWVNYTRNFPAGTYNLYARLANGNGGTATVYLDQITSGQGTASQGTLSLGSFQFPAQGWGTYSYVPLRDRYGNIAELTLSGVTTLRATAGGANMNFFMLATPRNDLPRISDVYPDGTLELQATNTFRFTASNPTVPIYSTNISLTLNEVDVTSQLTISGSPSSWSVSMPLALNVARYTAVITVRDANTNIATTTIYFDTFNPTNFTWEAEDYDFGSGQFFDNPVPTSTYAANSYFGQVGTSGVDYYLESSSGTTYFYRPSDLIPTDFCGDYPPLARYVAARLTDPNVKDYNLAFWTTNSWANYTRTYPAGTYNVYARMASGTGGSVQLDKITGGVTTHLGQFSLPNYGWGIYNWWPLVDTNGQPVTVTLGGVSILRATTDGSANANRFVLVTPLAAITPPKITATAVGGSVVLSFPTQSGRVYQVWAKDKLPDATWSLLASLSGNGSVRSWSEPATQKYRFYRLVVQ